MLIFRQEVYVFSVYFPYTTGADVSSVTLFILFPVYWFVVYVSSMTSWNVHGFSYFYTQKTTLLKSKIFYFILLTSTRGSVFYLSVYVSSPKVICILKFYSNMCALIDTVYTVVTEIFECQYVHLMTYAMYSIYVMVSSLD